MPLRTSFTPTPCTRQPIRQAVRPQMRVSRKHLQRPMPGDVFYLHHVQVGVFKKAGCGFVAQVVEGEIFNFRFFAGFDEGMSY